MFKVGDKVRHIDTGAKRTGTVVKIVQSTYPCAPSVDIWVEWDDGVSMPHWSMDMQRSKLYKVIE